MKPEVLSIAGVLCEPLRTSVSSVLNAFTGRPSRLGVQSSHRPQRTTAQTLASLVIAQGDNAIHHDSLDAQRILERLLIRRAVDDRRRIEDHHVRRPSGLESPALAE